MNEETKVSIENQKCVLIIDNSQPLGIITNTASVLSITLGEKAKGIVGPDILDKHGEVHFGITQIPIPILGATAEKIKEIRGNLLSRNMGELVLVDFTTIAQQSRTYDEYKEQMSNANENDIRYVGIAIYGDKKLVNKASGNLKLIK